jgi:DNA-binding transcriptional MerR regulator
MLLKIGELARRTGLTVRTLHHYDDIKLLCPSGRSPSGYRLYNCDDIERLHRIQALRRLDIPLAEIAVLLEGDMADLQTVIDHQIAALEQQVQRAMNLSERLKVLRIRIHSRNEADLNDWLDTLAMMSLYDKYFTPEELTRLRWHGRTKDRALDELVGAVRSLMERGVPPDSDEAVALAKPWLTLSLEHMAGDARLIRKLGVLHRNEANAVLLTGVDAELLDYMVRATAELRLRIYERYLGKAVVDEIRKRYLRHYLEWPELFAEAHDLYERGATPQSPEVLDLAARWIALFHAVWGADPELRLRILDATAKEPDIWLGSGLTEAMYEMVRKGIAYLREQQNKEKS